MRTLFVAALTVLACACAKSTVPPAGSQTHFLEGCEQSCAEPYACYCGVCTVPCSDSATCEEHSGDAQCVAPASRNAEGCSVSTTVCDVECEGDSDCVALGAAFECSEGRCREPGAPAAGEGGSGGMAGSGGTGGSGGVTSDAGRADAGDPNAGVICDGSDEIRVAYTSGGGFVGDTYIFTNPYGSFFIVDGLCRYYVGSDWLKGVRTGTLSEAQSAQLAVDAHWAELAELSAAPELESCPDAGASTIWTREFEAMCTCGCDAGPLADTKDAAMVEAYAWLERLETLGDPLTGSLSAIAREVAFSDGTEAAWPLDRPMTEIEFLIQDISVAGIGEPALFDDPAETMELRALRSAEAEATTFGAPRVGEDGTVYELYMRDELPLERADAIMAFLDGRHL